MRAHFFDQKYAISIIEFLATFKLANNASRFQEGAAMCVLTHYVNETPSNKLNGRMRATDEFSPIAALVRNGDKWSRKHLQSYLEIVNYSLKKFAKDQAIAEFVLSYYGTCSQHTWRRSNAWAI